MIAIFIKYSLLWPCVFVCCLKGWRLSKRHSKIYDEGVKRGEHAMPSYSNIPVISIIIELGGLLREMCE